MNQPCQYLTGTAHKSYYISKGQDCNNRWMGTVSMSSVANAIYNALCQFVIDPKKIVSETFMMAIFDKWRKKEINTQMNPHYLPKFDEW